MTEYYNSSRLGFENDSLCSPCVSTDDLRWFIDTGHHYIKAEVHQEDICFSESN